MPDEIDGTPIADPSTLGADALYERIPRWAAWLGRQTALELDVWTRQEERLKQRQAEIGDEAYDKAVRVALRAAAFDTGSVEGLYPTDRGQTISVAQETPGWESKVEEKTRRLFDDQLRAYELAVDLAGSERGIAEADIREIHAQMTSSQETYDAVTPEGKAFQKILEHGKYKTDPNHVLLADGSVFAYAPVGSTPDEMHRLVEELGSEAFLAASPLLQAAYAHYALVRIHPFSDGNGRVARALATGYLWKGHRIPLLLFADQKDMYLSSLEATDAGNADAFVLETFDLAVTSMQFIYEQAGPGAGVIAPRFKDLFMTPSGLSHAEMDKLGRDITTMLTSYFTEQIETLLGSDNPITSQVSMATRQEGFGDISWRGVMAPGGFLIDLFLTSPPPAPTQLHRVFQVLISKNKKTRYPFVVHNTSADKILYDVNLSDIYPEPTASLRLGLTRLAENELANALTVLHGEAEKILKNTGY